MDVVVAVVVQSSICWSEI